MDDFGPKATCSRVQMMANELGLRSPKCLTKIAEALKDEMRPFDLKRALDCGRGLGMYHDGGLYPRVPKKEAELKFSSGGSFEAGLEG